MTIYLDKICKSYNGVSVLKDFNAEIEWDRCYAFVGEEGAGKTTALKIFMGMEKPDSGEVSRMGDYKYPTLHSAYVSQEGQLNPRKNAVWNVKKAHRWASSKGAMEELSKFLPDDRQNVPVAELTEVEKRYVEIVRAIFVTADFLVFDEPFYGMNEEEKRHVLEYIMDKRGSRPLIIATRQEQDVQFAKIYRLCK